MNTTENNKLIAEFIGISKHKIDASGIRLNFENSKYNTYHKDWNFIMQVVEKIESLGLSTRDFTVKISYDICSIDFTNHSKKKETPLVFKRAVDQRNKIQAVYNACVEFIKWHNEQTNDNV